MSVKHISWAEPLKITPNYPDKVERNARYLARLYHEDHIKAPPIMEWAFLANVMQAYIGIKETLFSYAACMESKQPIFWIHYLREPFRTKADDSAIYRNTFFFAYGNHDQLLPCSCHTSRRTRCSRSLQPGHKLVGSGQLATDF